MLPRPSDLSFYNWETQTATSNATPNYQVLLMYYALSWCLDFCIQLFRETLSEKKHQSARDRPKGGLGIHWNFAYWPRGNLQVCIFADGKFVFPLRRPISVALLLLSHVFE